MDLDQATDIAESIAKVLEVLFSIANWLNGNVFSKSGWLVDTVEKVIDFFKGLFGDGGFLSGLFGGEGGGLGSIGDMFGGLFG